jgi:hypothetical protein
MGSSHLEFSITDCEDFLKQIQTRGKEEAGQ